MCADMKAKPPIVFVPLALTIAALCLACPLTAIAQVEIQVQVEKLPDDLRSLEPLIKANTIQAATEWATRVDAKPCTLKIVFRLDPAANAGRGSGRSYRTVRFGDEMQGDKFVSEQGWAAKMRTGEPPRQADARKPDAADAQDDADIEIAFEPNYFRTIWWDPEPARRQRRVPGDKLDSMSVLLHELAHALAFNGWIDPKTGKLPPGQQFISTYDRHVTFDGKDFFFNGPQAVKLWGKPVLLAHTVTNYHHVGDQAFGRDSELKADLMNGVVFEYGHRYWIGRLDLAILADCGIPLKPDANEPAPKSNPPKPGK
jgi:hypothetical protein